MVVCNSSTSSSHVWNTSTVPVAHPANHPIKTGSVIPCSLDADVLDRDLAGLQPALLGGRAREEGVAHAAGDHASPGCLVDHRVAQIPACGERPIPRLRGGDLHVV